MPIFEYFSPDTNTVYSFFARGSLPEGALPRCPDGDQFAMQKLMSGFAVVRRAGEKSSEGGDEAEDPRMEAAMAELEREMSGMDEENPDPRQMGHLMRRMSEITGEKMPEVMEEMVARLEKGEDPEKLEEEYGDLADMEDFADGDSGSNSTPGMSKALLRRMRGPVRDPELYEMSDYL